MIIPQRTFHTILFSIIIYISASLLVCCAGKKTANTDDTSENFLRVFVLKGKRKSQEIRDRLAEAFAEKKYNFKKLFKSSPKEFIKRVARVRVSYNGEVVSVKIFGDVKDVEEKFDTFQARIKEINFGSTGESGDTTEFEIPLTMAK